MSNALSGSLHIYNISTVSVQFCVCIIVSGRQYTTTVGHNDGSSEASDWLSPLRWAQKTGSDWLYDVLASFLRLAVAVLQVSQTDRLYAEGAMLMLGFISTAVLWMV